MNYLNIDKNEEHVLGLIKWLIDEVKDACGDGDALWYSRYYSVLDIKIFIEKNNLLPPEWKIHDRGHTLEIGAEQEWLTISNNPERLILLNSCQQATVIW